MYILIILHKYTQIISLSLSNAETADTNPTVVLMHNTYTLLSQYYYVMKCHTRERHLLARRSYEL